MLAPLEYVVIRMPEDDCVREVLPALAALQRNGSIGVIDILFIAKDADNLVTSRDVDELSGALVPYDELAGELAGLLTAEDIATLAEGVPVASSATVVLLEHRWVRDLATAISRAGGTLVAGGLIDQATLVRVSAELNDGRSTVALA